MLGARLLVTVDVERPDSGQYSSMKCGTLVPT
jgi:hypothetical protein